MSADTPADDSEDRMEDIVGWFKSNASSLVFSISFFTMLWVFRPYAQPFYYAIRFKYLGAILYAIAAIGVAVGAIRVFRTERRKIGYALTALAIVLLVFGGVQLLVAMPTMTKKEVADRTNATTDTVKLSTVPEVDTENTRTLTLKGAETQASTSFNKPTHRPSDGDLVMYEGDFATSHAILPDGLFKSFLRNQRGAQFVPMNTVNPNVTTVNQKFECGRGMLIFDDAKFKMQKKFYNTELKNAKTVPSGDSGNLSNMWLGEKHRLEFGFWNGIPTLYPVPYHSGVYVSDADCNQERLSPEEAINDPRFDGENKQQFYPYSLSKREVMYTNFKNGWLNTVTNQYGMKELPQLRSIDNEPPFTIMTEDGYKQMLTLEAIGEGTGVYEIYVIDGRTGEKERVIFNTNKKGPGLAVDETLSADSEKFGASKDKLTVSEVYPLVRDGELWYQSNAVQQTTGIYGYTTFFKADGTGTLLKAHNDEHIRAFYEGSNAQNKEPNNVISAPGNESEGRRTVSNPATWANVTSESGDVVYPVPVRENETVVIESAD